MEKITNNRKLEKETTMDKNEDDIQADEKRFSDAYEFLVEETTVRATIYNKQRHNRLSDLLELFEYLRVTDDENPLTKWFPED